MAMSENLMALMVLEVGVSPCYRLSNCLLCLPIDGSALATIWTVMPVVGIFVCLDEHCAAYHPYTTDKSVTDLLQTCYICYRALTDLAQINRVVTDLLHICHNSVNNFG